MRPRYLSPGDVAEITPNAPGPIPPRTRVVIDSVQDRGGSVPPDVTFHVEAEPEWVGTLSAKYLHRVRRAPPNESDA